MFHDGHHLNTVITWMQEDREQKYRLKPFGHMLLLVSIGPLAILSLMPALVSQRQAVATSKHQLSELQGQV